MPQPEADSDLLVSQDIKTHQATVTSSDGKLLIVLFSFSLAEYRLSGIVNLC